MVTPPPPALLRSAGMSLAEGITESSWLFARELNGTLSIQLARPAGSTRPARWLGLRVRDSIIRCSSVACFVSSANSNASLFRFGATSIPSVICLAPLTTSCPMDFAIIAPNFRPWR